MGHRIELPAELGKAFTVGRARDLGVGRARLANAEFARPFHGVRMVDYATAEPAGVEQEPPLRAVSPFFELLTAYSMRMPAGHFFSHTTAAEIWGMPLPLEVTGRIHVSALVPAKGPRGRGVIGHRLSDPGIEPVVLDGLRVADPTSTLLQCATVLRLDDLVALGDHAILEPAYAERGRPLVRIEEVRTRLDGYRGHGAVKAARAAALMRQGAESRPETLVRLAIRRAGLPEPVLQSTLMSPSGSLVARLDMDYPEFGVAVEYDGDQHRTSAVQYEKDILRLEAVRRAGRHVVRLRKSSLRSAARPAAIAVASALAEAGCLEATRALSPKSTLNRRRT